MAQEIGFFDGCSNITRGLFGGGYTPSRIDTISYVTIASKGDTIDFGNLTGSRGEIAATSSSIRGVFAGGNNPPTFQEVIDYVTIATTGNATDFGDLTQARGGMGGCSDSHGGLG